MKSKNISLLTMVVVNLILVVYNNLFFEILDWTANGYQKFWFLRIINLSIIAYAILTPTALITRSGLIAVIKKYEIKKKGIEGLKLISVCFNVLIMVSVMLSITKGFGSQEFKNVYLTVLVLGTINAIVVNKVCTSYVQKRLLTLIGQS
jgi:hypothetical protein